MFRQSATGRASDGMAKLSVFRLWSGEPLQLFSELQNETFVVGGRGGRR